MGCTCLAAALICTLVLVDGCGHKTTTDKSLQFVNTVEGQEMIAGRKKWLGLAHTPAGVWVDPRTELEFRAEHIPGAVNLPYERVSTDYTLLKKYDFVIVYGVDYNDPKADGMSKRLIELGIHDVHTLLGGLRAWKADGNPVEPGEANPAS
jgi:rhodanese-related sulfurtransferase